MTKAIQIKGVHVSLEGNSVLENVHLTVQEGEMVTISGPNGAGKTTLLRMILGLIRPQNGSVVVRGAAVGSRGWRKNRRRVAYLNQESIHVEFPISAYEVAEIGICGSGLSKQKGKGRVEEAMDLAGCLHLRSRAYSRLSGGEKQKVSLARCICQKPDILLLDEPCSSLDPEARPEIMGILEDLNRSKGNTIVMVSHDIEHIQLGGWTRYHLEHSQLLPSAGEGLV